MFTNNSGSLESASLLTGTTDSSFSTETDVPGRLLKRRLSPFSFNASSESIAYFYIKKSDFVMTWFTMVKMLFLNKFEKVAVDARGDSRVGPRTTLTMLWRNS